jgi:hypothetical protein
MRHRWVKAILLLLAGSACGEEKRPGLAGDVNTPSPEPDFMVDPNDTPKPSQISPCGAATVTLDFVRPNLYFALDASGSMTDAIPRGEGSYSAGTAPSNRYDAMARAIRTLLARVGHRVNYGATLFPSDDASCDAGEEIRKLAPGDDVSFAVTGEFGPLLQSFMYYVNRREPTGGTPVALTLRGLLPQLSGKGLNTYVFLVTDGGPNCNEDVACGPEACIPNIEHVSIGENISCDEDINCCDGRVFGPDNCLDSDASLQAVTALANANVRTFVIGMPGSEAYASLLDQLALAGGMARPEAPHYYRVGDSDALSATVSELGVTVAMSCTIELATPPPDPDLVNLFFDEQLVPSDPIDGWTFVGDKSVQVQGAACALLEGGQVLQADLIAGCPIVIR